MKEKIKTIKKVESEKRVDALEVTNKDKKEGESKRMKTKTNNIKSKKLLEFTNEKNKMQKAGITLIALVVTIVVLLILAGVSISAVFGDNGLIKQAQLSAFATEMQAVKDNVGLKQAQNALSLAQGTIGDIFEGKLNENSVEIPDTLKREILYAREGRPDDKSPDDYSVEDFDSLLDSEGNVDGIYIVDKQTGNGKEDTYVYDEETGTVFKIPPTRIGSKVYHSYETAMDEKGGTGGSSTSNKAIEQESDVITVGEERYYAPNLKGFSGTETYVIYYSEDTTETKEDITAQEYIENGEKYQITEGGKTYTFHDYSKPIWANIKTVSNEQEAWWIWVPRYAYLEDKTSNTESPVGIIFTDINDKPLNSKYEGVLPEGYKPHPAFDTKDGKLKGIWMSKYEPTYSEQYKTNSVLAPDMTGFDPENTYIELFDKNTDTFKSNPIKLADANLSTVNNNKEWYDYENNVWANVKTVGFDQEAWWVWIPRYAYKLVETNGIKRTYIIYVDLKNKPIDKAYNGKLPAGYKVHPAFDTEEGKLKGIWMSKYEPTYSQMITSSKVLAPDMTGFDPQSTYIELFDKENDTFKENPQTVANTNFEKVNENKEWYDYENNVWANVKTIANGEEAWWVWVPRYAYKVIDNSPLGKEIEIIYIGLNNKPLDTEKYGEELPKGFKVHPAFTTTAGNLKGIWMSKYEPTEK